MLENFIITEALKPYPLPLMKLLLLFIILFIIDITAFAQITGSGNVGYLSKFSGTTIVTSSLIFENGTNIGIGISIPSVKLEVSNGTNGFKLDPNLSTLTISGPSHYVSQSPRVNFNFNADPNSVLAISAYSHDNVALVFDAYNNGSSWVSSHAGSNFSIYKANNELIIGYNSDIPSGKSFNYFNLTNGVRFGNNGNLGIGIAAGKAKLEVLGGSGNEAIRISSIDNEVVRYLSSSNFDIPALSYHAFKDNELQKATAEISFLDRPGTSGYGQAVRTSDILLKTAHNWNGIAYGQYLDTTVTIRANQSGGYVGIGILLPQAKLDVNGNIYCRNTLYVGLPDVSTTTQMSNYKLAVNGTDIFNKAIVKLYGNWPDYVFDNSYKLLPLADLQKYIELNKHLPEMTSAKETQKNGIDIGINQALLLKKIEELTLYIIDINKKVEAISNENERLKNSINSLNL